MLHAKCGSRIKLQNFCPVDNEVVERSALVRGYEFAKDQYVRVTDDELKALEGEASKMIDILEFVPLAQVDPVYFEKTYYLGADKGGEKPYRLLADAMAQAEQVAVAKFVMRGKESLVLIRAAQDGLLLHTMFFADEVRSFADIDKGRSANVREGELGLALQLIRGLARDDFKPDQYKDDYRERVTDMLQRKIEGREIIPAPAPAERPRVIDLMDALKASLAKRGLPESAATAKKPPSKAATAAGAKVAAKAVAKRASGGRK
jgi:DNA end-binding protein Ku